MPYSFLVQKPDHIDCPVANQIPASLWLASGRAGRNDFC